METINLEVLESNLQRGLDEVYSLLERIKIKQHEFGKRNLIEVNLDKLANTLIEIELKHKDVAITDGLISKSIYLLQVWFKIVNLSKLNNELEYVLINNLKKLLRLCLNYLVTKDPTVIDSIDDFQTSIGEIEKHSYNHYVELERAIKLFCTDSIISNIDENILHKNIAGLSKGIREIKVQLIKDIFLENEWDVEVFVKDHDISKEFFLLSVITRILGLENKNLVNVESIHLGSFLLKLKTKFTNIWNKKETKEILNLAKDEIIAYGSMQSIENDKTKAETDKTKIESEQLKRELESQTKEDILQRKELELRMLTAEVIGKELDNEMKKIEIFERLSQLLVSGISQVEQFELRIGGQTIIKKLGNNISGEDIK